MFSLDKIQELFMRSKGVLKGGVPFMHACDVVFWKVNAIYALFYEVFL